MVATPNSDEGTNSSSIDHTIDLIFNTMSLLIHNKATVADEEAIFYPLQVFVTRLESRRGKPVVVTELRGRCTGLIL